MKTIFRNNYKPRICDFKNTIVHDAAVGANYFFDCDGVYTRYAVENTFVFVEETVTLAPGEPARVEAERKGNELHLTFYIPQGQKGDTGDAATVAVGKTTTLAPGSKATVENVGDEYHAIFEFGIPEGKKGDRGPEGPEGPEGPQGIPGAGGVIKTVEGNPIKLTDSADSSFVSYEIVGERSTQQTPSLLYRAPASCNTITSVEVNNNRQLLSTPVSLYGLDEVRDSIEKVDDVWGVMHRVWKYEFTGVEEWKDIQVSGKYIRAHTIMAGAEGNSGEINCISDAFVSTNFVELSNAIKNVIASWRNTGEVDGRVDICVETAALRSADNAGIKEWLSGLKDVGNPITVTYRREPIFEPLPQADQELFNSLKTFKTDTVITTQAPQKLEYYADIQTLIDKKQNKLIAGDGIKLEEVGEETKISATPQSANLVVTTTANPLDPKRFICDYSSTEINNARIAGKTVEMHFEDTIEKSGNQVYTFLKQTSEGSFFRRMQLMPSGEVRQIDIKVDYAKNVVFTDSRTPLPDTEMSETSENAVQNKVIKAYVDDLATIPVEVKGNPAICEGSIDGKPTKYEIDGAKSTQNTYEGYNLFNVDAIISNAWSGNTLTNNGDGSITLSIGEASPDVMYGGEPNNHLKDFAPTLQADKTYTLQIDGDNTRKELYLRGSGRLWQYGTSKTIYQSDLDNSVGFYASGQGSTATLRNFQIVEGDKPKPFEPYTGGQPAPNPDYPQEIKHTRITSISDTGKNLFNKEKDIADSSEKLTQIATTPKDPQNIYLADGTYTLSVKTTGSLGGKIQVDYYDTAGDFYFIGELTDQVSELTFTCTNLNRINIRTNKVTDIQIEKGEQATTYEPYKGGIYELSKPIDLYGLGDVRDSIEKRDGAWGVMRRTTAWSFKSEERQWFKLDAQKVYFTDYPPEAPRAVENVAFCNLFLNSQGRFQDQHFTLSDVCYIKDETSQSIDEWNARISGKIFNFVSTRLEPIFEPLPEADQVIFKSLRTFKPFTVISTQAEQTVGYRQTIKAYVDAKIAELVPPTPEQKVPIMTRPAIRPEPQVIDPAMSVDPNATLEVEQPNDTPSKS